VKLERILVTSAWPYIQHILHLGNLLPILSADVMARYYRLKGNDVLFVSGSDVHGTPIEVEAVRQGISPKELTEKNHKRVVDLFKKWMISFDNYSTTESPVHKEFVMSFHRKVAENGYVFSQESELPYCPKCKRFLPDRFVEGECPYCGYKGARGDQCEQCGRLLDPTKLINAHCSICGSQPLFRKTLHWYFDLPKFADQLREYITNNKQFPDNARNFSLKFIEEGLKPRPMTRDSDWGIPAPFPGAEGKTLYVWFENVLGYISATIEYFKRHGDPDGWRRFWFNKDAKILCFIGKDNIPFHTIIFPALLLATHEGYNLPWNVSTNEWLNFEGQKSSKSRKVGIWIDEALKMFPADYWRYTLMANRPETSDTNFTWKIFLEKVNSDLNDTLGNFIHRTLTFINNYFDGKVPKPGRLDKIDREMLNAINEYFRRVDECLSGFHIQAATKNVIDLAREGNRYLNEKKPWKAIKLDPQSAATTLYVSIQIVKALSVLLEPFIPSTAQKIRRFLNLTEKMWWEDAIVPLEEGHEIKEAKPIFEKINLSEEELQGMLEEIRALEEKVSFEEFSRIDMRVGRIIGVERIPGSRNLLKLTIDVGLANPKVAVAGISKYYRPEELLNRHIVVVANLKPKKIFGIESEVMILAAQNNDEIALIQPEKPIRPGSKVR